MDEIYGEGPALHAINSMHAVMSAQEAELRRAAAIERVQTKVMLDEYRALPVGDRLAAKYWHLRATVSPLAIAAHQMASLALARHTADRLRRHPAHRIGGV